MGVFNQSHKPSFRGVPFVVESEATQGGKKTVSHEYVNSNKRYTEELGKIPPKFTLNVKVHGDDAIQKRFNLENALNLPGLGELVHPIYGVLQAKSTTYTVSSNQTNIGEFRFSINFEITESNITTRKITDTSFEVSTNASLAASSVSDKAKDVMNAPGTAENLSSLAETADASLSWLEKTESILNLNIDKAADFTRLLNETQNNIFVLAQSPEVLINTYDSLIASVNNLADVPEDLEIYWRDLLGYGVQDTNSNSPSVIPAAISPTTVRREEAEQNRSAFNEYLRLNALSYYVEALSYKDFDTDDDLEEARGLIESAYRSLILDLEGVQAGDGVLNGVQPLGSDLTVRQSVYDLIVSANAVFDTKDQNAWKVVDIAPSLSSAMLTAYDYYGDIENIDLLMGLNKDIAASNFNQPIKAVSR